MPKNKAEIKTFEEWLAKNHTPGQPIDAKTIWDAATALERNACANLCFNESHRITPYLSRHSSIKKWRLVGMWEAGELILKRS